MKQVNFQFREKLKISHNYCYQCGACVADCPAHRFNEAFNPRLIILRALLGLEDELIGEDSLIWNCTNCYNCYERCPQEVHPIEVIIALKNISVAENKGSPAVGHIMQRVKDHGYTVQQTSLTDKRRSELGLAPFKGHCAAEIGKLFE